MCIRDRYVSIYWWGSYFFSITSTIDFQSVSSRSTWKEVINVILTLITNVTLASLLVLIAFWLPQLNIYTDKTSPYECGFDPMGSARLPFSIKFFLVAITFLLFDLEIALLLPLPWASQTNKLTTILIIALLLISLLAASLAYEWTEKGLEWTEYDN
mgnify:FL=1